MFSLKYICLRDFENIKEGTIVLFLFSESRPQEPYGIGIEENSTIFLPYKYALTISSRIIMESRSGSDFDSMVYYDDSVNHFFAPLRSYKLNKILEKIQQNKLLD